MENEQMPQWAKDLIESNKAMAAKIEQLGGDRVSFDRKQQLSSKLQNADARTSERILRDFERMKFKDDADFQSYLKVVDSDLGDASSAEPSKEELDNVFKNVNLF